MKRTIRKNLFRVTYDNKNGKTRRFDQTLVIFK